jgi:hypothetical protein
MSNVGQVPEERKPAEQELAEQDSCRPSGDQHELNSKDTEEVCIKAPGLQSSEEYMGVQNPTS